VSKREAVHPIFIKKGDYEQQEATNDDTNETDDDLKPTGKKPPDGVQEPTYYEADKFKGVLDERSQHLPGPRW